MVSSCRFIIGFMVAAMLGVVPIPAGAKPVTKDVSLRFVRTPVPVIMRALAEQVGFDLVVSPGIDATVDVSLNDVPWETALDAIVSSNNLTYQWHENVLVIVPMDAESAGLLVHEVVRLHYASPAAVKAILTGVMKAPAKAELLQSLVAGPTQTSSSQVAVPPILVLSETPQGMPSLLALIDSLDVPRPQFEIEVKFVETTLDDKLGVGFSWPTSISASIASENQSADEADTETNGPAAEYDIPDGKIWRFGTLSIDQVSGFMEMLNQKGKSKLLSNPRVSVVESERAVMKVTRTIPVQTINRFTDAGSTQDIVTFQDLEVGMTLTVIPRLNEGDIMTLDLEPVVEEIVGVTGPPEDQRPITSNRSVKTTVRVKSDETVVIGGLVRESDVTTKSKLFLLGDIPILGELFTHRKIEKQKSDLLIFITPRLIEPVAAN